MDMGCFNRRQTISFHVSYDFIMYYNAVTVFVIPKFSDCILNFLSCHFFPLWLRLLVRTTPLYFSFLLNHRHWREMRNCRHPPKNYFLIWRKQKENKNTWMPARFTCAQMRITRFDIQGLSEMEETLQFLMNIFETTVTCAWICLWRSNSKRKTFFLKFGLLKRKNGRDTCRVFL